MQRRSYLFLIQVFLLICPTISLAQQRNTQPVTLAKVSDRLYQVLGGRGAQGAAYVGDNGILIVDAKMDKQSVDQVIAGVGQISQKPIRYLVNTHSDGDHIRGNRYFPETVAIVAHENCRVEFFHPGRNGTASEWKNPELAPFLPDLTFRDKMDIYLGSQKVELWYFGVGHTTGDAVVYFPEEKAAFLGDQIFLSRPQLIHSYKGGNSFEYVKTVTKMLETIDAEMFLSGHSEPIDRSSVRNHVKRMKDLQEKVKVLVNKGASLEETKSEFTEEEGRLVEVIYKEVKTLG